MTKLIGIIVLSALLAVNASAATLTVNASGGADYARIQDAIDNASAGDTILVYRGVYYENINLKNGIKLQGEGADMTIIDGRGVSVVIGADNSTIDGFTITNSSGMGYAGVVSLNSTITNNTINNNPIGIISNSHSSPIIRANVIRNNTGYTTVGGCTIGSGIQNFDLSNPLIENNIIEYNSNGIRSGESSPTIINNVIRGNQVGENCGPEHAGIYLYSNSAASIKNNIITGNEYGINIWNGFPLASYNQVASYNNIFNNTNNFVFSGTNNNTWNTSKTPGINIIGGPYLSGNFWANPSGTGFSQTCTDADRDGICDTNYTLNVQNIDYLPLSLNFTTTIPSESTIGYSATVATGQNTYVQSSNGTFGLLLKGQTKTINNSVILNNIGDISAKVEARFNDSISGVFGLISGANVLNATNFALGISGVPVSLDNSGADVQVAVAPPGVTALDARLGVPNEQAAGDYSGTVVLTFSNNV